MTARKGKRLWAWGLAVLALLLLAASLAQFEPGSGPGGAVGIELPFSPLGPASPSGGGTPTPRAGLGFWDVLYRVVLWVLLPIAIVYYLVAAIVSSDGRTRALAIVLVLLSFVLLGQVLQSMALQQPEPTPTPLPGEEAAEPAAPAPAVLTATVQPGAAAPAAAPVSSPEWFVWATAAVLALLLIAAGALVVRRLRQPRAAALEQISQQAQETLAEVRAGTVDLKDAVTRCYVQMSRALSEQRGMVRPDSMTPREFEQRLIQAGLPRQDVHRLTQLFEKVRYGACRPGLVEEREAVSCLTAIVQACGGTA